MRKANGIIQNSLSAIDTCIITLGMITSIMGCTGKCKRFIACLTGDYINNACNGITSIQGTLTTFKYFNTLYIIDRNIPDIKIAAYP